mmetsp:Transcript_41068/g.103486  ORF Transcript_41068/g.103486 Transcript_41068/m.103486 type:complete len:282 (+) Transcript_41068:2312-3157(+)
MTLVAEQESARAEGLVKAQRYGLQLRVIREAEQQGVFLFGYHLNVSHRRTQHNLSIIVDSTKIDGLGIDRQQNLGSQRRRRRCRCFHSTGVRGTSKHGQRSTDLQEEVRNLVCSQVFVRLLGCDLSQQFCGIRMNDQHRLWQQCFQHNRIGGQSLFSSNIILQLQCSQLKTHIGRGQKTTGANILGELTEHHVFFDGIGELAVLAVEEEATPQLKLQLGSTSSTFGLAHNTVHKTQGIGKHRVHRQEAHLAVERLIEAKATDVVQMRARSHVLVEILHQGV